ncbi:hypothetical protein AHAS_Ahas05G0035100 [Arachis hypogaea]
MARWGPQESEPSVILIRDALSHSKTVNVIDKMEGRGPRGRVWTNWGRECGPPRWHFPPKGNGIMKQCTVKVVGSEVHVPKRKCNDIGVWCAQSGAPAVSVDNVPLYLTAPRRFFSCLIQSLVVLFQF